MSDQQTPKLKPGVCVPWSDKIKEHPPILGDEKCVEKVWEDIDTLGYLYIWFCLIGF